MTTAPAAEPVERPGPEALRPARRALPPASLPALIFCLWVTVVPLALHDRLLNADGDLARHIRHGETMLRQHGLITADPFSFTRGGQPFLGFEYGAQVLLGLAHHLGGLPGVAVLAGFLIAATYAVLARMLLRRGVDPLLACLVTMTAAVLGSMHWSARPHLVTLLAVAVLMDLIENRRSPWLVIVLFVVWTNLHGGFVFGLVLLGLYLAGDVLEWLVARSEAALAEVRRGGLLLALAVIAPLANPHGLGLYDHLRTFFGEQRTLFELTEEFHSPDFHTTGGKVFFGVIALSVLAFALARKRPSWTHLTVVLANLGFALSAERNIPLYGLTALPLLAVHANDAWRRLPDWRGIRAVFERDAARGRTWPFVLPVAALMVLVAAARGRVGDLTLIPDRFDSRVFPVAAVAQARAAGLRGRLFHEFMWGGYILYAWPEQRVFVDGGTDFYGPDLVREYLAIHDLAPGWRERLRRWDVSLVLVPGVGRLAHELVRDGGWRIRWCDSTAVLLQRGDSIVTGGPSGSAGADAREAQLERCTGPRSAGP